jgi:hypothetical protein
MFPGRAFLVSTLLVRPSEAPPLGRLAPKMDELKVLELQPQILLVPEDSEHSSDSCSWPWAPESRVVS